MPREYKRKRQISYSSDANYNRKSINSGERKAAQRDIDEELRNLPTLEEIPKLPKRVNKA